MDRQAEFYDKKMLISLQLIVKRHIETLSDLLIKSIKMLNFRQL